MNNKPGSILEEVHGFRNVTYEILNCETIIPEDLYQSLFTGLPVSICVHSQWDSSHVLVPVVINELKVYDRAASQKNNRGHGFPGCTTLTFKGRAFDRVVKGTMCFWYENNGRGACMINFTNLYYKRS